MNYRPCSLQRSCVYLGNVTVASIVLVLFQAHLAALSTDSMCIGRLSLSRLADNWSFHQPAILSWAERGSVVILVGIDAGLLDDIPALSSALMIALDDRGSICINFFFWGGLARSPPQDETLFWLLHPVPELLLFFFLRKSWAIGDYFWFEYWTDNVGMRPEA